MKEYVDHLKETFVKPLDTIGKSYGEIFMQNKEKICLFEQFKGLNKLGYVRQWVVMQLARFCQQQNDEESIKQIQKLCSLGIENDNFEELAERTIAYLKKIYNENLETLHKKEQSPEVESSIKRYENSIRMLIEYDEINIQKKKNNHETINLLDIPTPGYAIMPSFALAVIAAKVNIGDITNYIKEKEINPHKDDGTIIDEIIVLREQERLKNLQAIDTLEQSL